MTRYNAMTLIEAMRSFESGLRVVADSGIPTSTDPAPLEYNCIVSGAHGFDPRKPYPLLCLTPELAVEEWLAAAMSYRAGIAPSLSTASLAIHWKARPVLDKLRITIADDQQTQRVVEDRFVVRCRCAIFRG